MKKLFTLIAAAFLSVGGVNAQTDIDLSNVASWGWSWNASYAYADGVATITLTGDGGQGSTGWDPVQDWSKYGTLSVVIESYTGEWGQVGVYTKTVDPESSWGEFIAVGKKDFAAINEQTTITVNLDPEQRSTVYQLYIKGNKEGDVIKVSRVYLTEAAKYGEGKTLEMDASGQIMASEFEGYSDNAKVEFTIEATGEATVEQGGSLVSNIGWGIGAILGLDWTTKVADLNLQKIGDNVYSFTLAELKPALAASTTWGDTEVHGVVFSVYGSGNAVCKAKSAVIYEVASEAELWTIAGVSGLLGSGWDTADTSNDMTTEDGVTYTLVKEGVELEAGVNYEYKVAKDHQWAEAYPGSNAILTVDETATYTVTFTFNSETKELSAKAVKTGEAVAKEHTWGVVGDFNSWANDIAMTKGEDGIYTVTIKDLKAGNYEFKVRADGDWTIAYPSSNYQFTVESDGSAVTITFNPETNEVNAEVTVADGIRTVQAAQQDGIRYNVAGQQVGRGYKGLVIVNGRKVLVK